MLSQSWISCCTLTPAGCVLAGDSQPMDVCSVHHDDSFLRYSVSLLGYGFYGDVLTDSERNRRLGPARYDLAGRMQDWSTSTTLGLTNLKIEKPQAADYRGTKPFILASFT